MNEWMKSGNGKGWISDITKNEWSEHADRKKSESTKSPITAKHALYGVASVAAGLGVWAYWEPLLLTLEVGGAVGALGGAAVAASKMRYQRVNKFVAIQVKPKENGKVNMEKVQKMIEGFGQPGRTWLEEHVMRGRVWFRWQIVKDDDSRIRFYFICPEEISKTAIDMLKLGFPGCSTEIDKNYKGLPDFYTNEFTVNKAGEKERFHVGHMKYVARDQKALGLKNQLENNIGDILYMMPNESILELRFSPTEVKELRESGRDEINEIQDDARNKKKMMEEAKKIKLITERYMGRTAFDVNVIIYSKRALKRLANSVTQHTKGLNALTLKQYHLFPKLFNPYKYDMVTPLPSRKMVWNDIELANLLTLPPAGHPVLENIEIALEKLKPKVHELNKGIQIAVADHNELIVKDEHGKVDFKKSRPIKVTMETFTEHPVISGKTGSGKAAAIVSILDDYLEKWVDDPKRAPGFTLNDPHGLTIYLIINRLQEIERTRKKKVDWSRIKCFHVGSETFPMPLNLLTKDAATNIDNMIEETTEIILRAFESSNLTQSKMLIENGLAALLYDKKPRTIAELPRLFQKETKGRRDAKSEPSQLLREVLPSIRNRMIQEWFEREVIDAKDEKNLSAMVTRLSPFLYRENMQRMYMQSENAFADTKKIFDDGHIVLINYQGVPDGHPAFKLTAGWIANRYHQEMKKRNPDNDNRPHLLIFDEMQMFHVPRFVDIVAQDRKFGFGLVTITQDIHKLDPALKSALTINSSMMVSLNQSEGARVMSELMRGKFEANHLANLPKMHAALWSLEGSANILFPAPAFKENGNAVRWKDDNDKVTDHHKKVSRQAREKFEELVARDARPAKIVDAEIDAMLTGKAKLSVAE